METNCVISSRNFDTCTWWAGQAISFVLELVKDYFWNFLVAIVYHISSQKQQLVHG